MVHFFGGVTPIITPDNAKVAVTSNNDYADPVLNKDYNEWAQWYGTALMPARVKAPDDKPGVAQTTDFRLYSEHRNCLI